MKHSEEKIKQVLRYHEMGLSNRLVAINCFGSSTKESTVRRIIKNHKYASGGVIEPQLRIVGEGVGVGGNVTYTEKTNDLIDALSYLRNTPLTWVERYEAEDKGLKILLVTDCQVKSGIDMTYLDAIGQYIVDKKPDVVVCIGDFWDFPSLSSYDKGKLSFEGRRLSEDIEAGKEGMCRMLKPLKDYQKDLTTDTIYKPRLVFTLGNHEERLKRVPSNNSEFEGFIGYHLLELEKDWEVYDYLKPVNIQGINFVHFLANPFTGKPYGGNALSQLKNVGSSFCVGHKQTLDVAIQPVLDGSMRLGIICGACYPYDEDYKGYTGNNHFRGVVMLHDAKDGYADPSFISTKFLIERLKNGNV